MFQSTTANNKSQKNFFGSLSTQEEEEKASQSQKIFRTGFDGSAPIDFISDSGATTETAQLASSDKEEELQMKAKEEEELPFQGKNIVKEKIQKKSASSSGSTAMPNDVQAKMEGSFGTDFSGVNIHANDQSATQMGALAYTQSNDVHFAPGQYNPGSQKGQELLGHELTHVVQQRQGRVAPTKQGKGLSVNDSPSLEKEADVMGVKAAAGNDASMVKGNGSGVQKQSAGGASNSGEGGQHGTSGVDLDQDSASGTVSEQEETLEERLDRIEGNYRNMITDARGMGYNVAADNLEHFLDGGGRTRTLSSGWLRSFAPVTNAEDINHGRFEESLKKIADSMSDGQSRNFTDYWDRGLYARGFTELFYASGGSNIKSTGNFSLSRTGNKVTISGTVDHHWSDPYDWHAGLTALVPGYGNISDADALLLQQHRGARPFNMVGDWRHTLSGYVETDRWFDYFGTEFIWKKS